jgi:23S rRNA (uracil1939-C5)-methyltransferase
MTNHIKNLPIDKLVAGGYGLGRTAAGKVVLVHGVIPGESVDVQVFRSKKSYDLGFVTAVVQPSPQRIQPLCPLFGQCGGCTLQHLAYEDQVQYKEQVFSEDWKRFFKQPLPHPDLHFLRAEDPFGYRQRIRLHIVDGNPCFYRHHSQKPIAVSACLLAKPPINDCLQRLDSLAVYQELKYHINELVLHHNPENDCCVLELYFTRRLRPTDRKYLRQLVNVDMIQSVRAYGEAGELICTEGDELNIHFSMGAAQSASSFSMVPGDFCQVNMAQNQTMLDFIMSHIDHDQSAQILDLFCGLGNFSIPLARLGHKVTGVDLKRSAIRSAENNNELNKTDATFIRMSAQDGVQAQIRQARVYDIVILDPPRAGFKEGAGDLAELKARQIFYIACDQQTQLRDLQQLIASGYAVKEVCLVDMFPQTHHLESVVMLELDG